MEVARHPFYVFDLDEVASVLSFLWSEASVSMTDEDYKDALRAYARLVLKHRVRGALIDLRRFQYKLADEAALGSFWASEIVPLYNEADLRRFAFVLPAGTPVPPDDAPADSEPGQTFLTKQFGSYPAAIAWLTAS